MASLTQSNNRSDSNAVAQFSLWKQVSPWKAVPEELSFPLKRQKAKIRCFDLQACLVRPLAILMQANTHLP